ncbi:hypothetical protein [Roseateles flavus]|uniref:Phosphoglycerate mutase n=1 Tax=Roseateles flavus TaxID=3149041 RepID=A0ABV0GB23_9BURK
MHLVIPYASAMDPQARAVLADLQLPALDRALADLGAGPRFGGDEYSPALPQERLLAALAGLPEESPPPLAAWALGASAGSQVWARLTPLHCDVGSDQVTALDPEALGLDAASSQALLFEALAPLFPEEEGWALMHQAAGQWFISHERLQGLETASLDRVIHRNVDAWLPEPRQLLRLQMEAQMTLHGHPLNTAREQAGLRPINSVWIWGCGSAADHALPADIELDEQLRTPWIAGDWTAWAEAWRLLDARRIAPLLPALAAGTATLSLAGERQALTLRPQPRSWTQRLWQQLRPTHGQAARLLESL